ncbi:MAG: DUF1810 domain-containing protein [Burkholderiales bacterium]|nr:DUF1810 domain-containing protein [Burkholderiales bacterium]
MRSDPPPGLARFVEAQAAVYESVLAELRAGRKSSHWMWFIFPQLRALGRSGTARFYGLADRTEAAAYWQHPVLGERLRQCARLVLATRGKTAHEIFGSPDDLKLRSCMTLFAAVAPEEPEFAEVLARFYAAEGDPLTLAELNP